MWLSHMAIFTAASSCFTALSETSKEGTQESGRDRWRLGSQVPGTVTVATGNASGSSGETKLEA